MRFFSTAMACAALVLAPLPALAAGFVGVNYVNLQQDDRFFGDDKFTTGELLARLGGEITPYWMVELRAGTTVAPNEGLLVSNGAEGEFRHKSFFGVLTRFQWPLGSFTPYVGVGYSEISETVDGDDALEDSSFNDGSFAAGMDVRLGRALGLNVEYFQLADEENVSRHGPSVGIFYSF